MATTGSFKGNKIVPIWDGVAIGCTTDFTFDGSNSEIDATCKDNDGAKSTLPGEQSITMSAAGLQVYDATSGIEQLMSDFANKVEETLAWSTGVSGDKKVFYHSLYF